MKHFTDKIKPFWVLRINDNNEVLSEGFIPIKNKNKIRLILYPTIKMLDKFLNQIQNHLK